MQNNIIFFQSTSLGGNGEVGLIDLLNLHLKQQQDLFTQMQIIVPNQAMAVWVKDQLARKNGICANIDCVVLSGTLIDNIYLANNPDHTLCDFSSVRYIIYQVLQNANLSNFPELVEFLQNSKSLAIDKLKAYQLSCQLERIYHEYLYLRTDEMINLTHSNFNSWQKFIWQQILLVLDEQKTFLDVYQYFAQAQKIAQLPKNIFVFGLTSSYPSQLKILGKLADLTNVYWYYQSCSNNYYGDLLSEKARSKIEQRLLRKPDLTIDDLYLTGGNRLLANLGQQSREFVELLRVNDVNVYEFEAKEIIPANSAMSLLELVQTDIRNLSCRIRPELRLSANTDYYQEPLRLDSQSESGFVDLASGLTTIKVNVCHNRMREVQVMFNQLLLSLDKNNALSFADILVVAPDIDDYASYIQAVFDNEFTLDQAGNKCFLPYSITGNRRHKTSKILESLRLILASPYQLTVNYLIDILQDSEIQSGLELDFADIDLIKRWLFDNHTHFGYDKNDLSQVGYANYSVFSFKQLLINLVLGSCIDEQTFGSNHSLPYLANGADVFTPYDNLENAQIGLVNKLIQLIELLEEQRQLFYVDEHIYTELTLHEVADFLAKYAILINDDEVGLIFDEFIGYLRSFANSSVDLAVLLAIIDEYIGLMKNRLSLNGKITCMSMQYARNLPYKYIYVLGMNFGEYPTSYQPDQLSILAKEWYLADRNYNIEDKQAFLDILLAAKEQLTISYIGRKETDNSEIKPSPLLGLLLEVIGQSVTNFWQENDNLLKLGYDYLNLVEVHALHPFYNNQHKNYAQIWHEISKITNDSAKLSAWDFSQDSPIKLTTEQLESYLQINFKALMNVFRYTNNNLLHTLGLSSFNDEIELEDEEPLVLYERNVARNLYQYFEKYANCYEPQELADYLRHKGILGYADVGQLQFDYYYSVYQKYRAKRGTQKIEFQFSEKLLDKTGQTLELNLTDELYLENNNVIICDEFVYIKDDEKLAQKKFSEISYSMRLRGLIIVALLSKSADFIQKHAIENIVLRQMNINGESKDFILSVDDPEPVLLNILRFYLRSLTNPILIHEKAILGYAKDALNEAKAQLNAQQAFYVSYENTGIDKLKQDPIFVHVLEDYFTLPRPNKFNDIYFIGKLLAQLTGE